MRLHTILAVSAAVLTTASARADELSGDTTAAILRELREIRRTLAEVQAELAALKKERAEEEVIEKFLRETHGPFRPRDQWVDLARFAKITLPENPTEEQIRTYVREIAHASKNQGTYSSMDPQVSMLGKVGGENLHLLIDEWLTNLDDVCDFYFEAVVAQLAAEEHKDLFLEALPRKHVLVSVILKRGWEQDAKRVLLDEATARPHGLPKDWIKAIGRLDSPEARDVLRLYLIQGSNRASTFEVMREIPRFPISDILIAQAWQAAQRDPLWEAESFAAIAVDYGHMDALLFLVDRLAAGPEAPWVKNFLEKAILRHIQFRGTNEEVIRWVRGNAARLIFDPEAKKFVRGPVPAPVTSRPAKDANR